MISANKTKYIKYLTTNIQQSFNYQLSAQLLIFSLLSNYLNHLIYVLINVILTGFTTTTEY